MTRTKILPELTNFAQISKCCRNFTIFTIFHNFARKWSTWARMRNEPAFARKSRRLAWRPTFCSGRAAYTRPSSLSCVLYLILFYMCSICIYVFYVFYVGLDKGTLRYYTSISDGFIFLHIFQNFIFNWFIIQPIINNRSVFNHQRSIKK